MPELTPSDRHRLSAAQGWLELGNPAEAEQELQRLSAGAQNHPQVLNAYWEILSRQQRWEAGLSVARRLIIHAPDQPDGWIHQAYCLHELKRTQEAWDCLRPLAERFPNVGVIPYNLACYACQLGRLEDAREWLTLAMTVDDRAKLREMALKDPDLKLLWPELC